ncbi:MAG: hypothetical protein QNJ58_03935 [Desulfobacterales bacterium]|nr:hypothetical protein [Desulfobacterales bacterium]
MSKKLLKDFVPNPNHIPGIYNYCDRWCERCPFTSRCLNYEMSEEKFGDLEDGDLSNEVFWQRMSDTLQETMSMLKEMAEERGIDLDSLETDAGEERDNPLEDKPVVHMTIHMAKSYIDAVKNWFDENVYIYEDDVRELAAELEPDAVESPAGDDTVTLIDSVEIIRWYQHQIYVKLQRAIHSSRDEEFEIENGFPKDSDGSTKVALIGMDRSISAWGKMINYFPEQRDSILGIITHLERLRRRTEKKFPDARAFVRPGFDEIVDKDRPPSEST